MRDETLQLEELPLPATWYRNREGTTVHRPSCRYAAEPWPWAEGWTEERLAEYVSTMFHVKHCRTCFRDKEER